MGMVDIFLKIDGIEGESQDSKHAKEIEVLSWSWGASQTGTMAYGGGGSAGKVQFQDLQFTHNIDKASTNLSSRCWDGKHIKSAILYQRKATGEGKQEEFLKITLADLIVTSVNQSSSGEVPSETASLNFSDVIYEYRPQKADGSMDAWITVTWDLKKNTKK